MLICNGIISVNLKLLIDTRSNTVVFAEANKSFVDWLFDVLAMPLPLALVVGMSITGQMDGSLGNLITSIQSLINSHHIATKDARFYQPLGRTTVTRTCTCPRGHDAVAATSAFCPDCCVRNMATLQNVAPPKVKEGTYIVTDDLVVKPVEIANHFDGLRISEVDALEERVVDMCIGQDEAIKLIHAAFSSKKVLTDVFILRLSSVRSFKFAPSNTAVFN